MSVSPTTSRKRRRRRPPAIPRQIRRPIAEFARQLAKQHPEEFASDYALKNKVSRLLRAMLPPRPRRRGRPRNETVTRAIVLHRQLRKKHPQETPQAIWARVYPLAIVGYSSMSDMEQRDARELLQQRVAWRRRRRKKQSRLGR